MASNRQYTNEEMKELFKIGEGTDVEFMLGIDEDDNEGGIEADEEKPAAIMTRNKKRENLMKETMMKKESKERKQLFKAHRFVLSSGSPVFETQFNFPIQQEGPIPIVDLTPESFKIMLAYLYLKTFDGITSKNVLDVYSAAKKYMINSLMKFCLESLYNNENLTQENVFMALEHAKFHDEKELFGNCLYFIKKRPEVLKSAAFLELNLDQIVELFLKLNIQEILLFKALYNWASKKIENDLLLVNLGKKKKKKPIISKQMIRDVIGDAIFVIQFQLMSRNEFFNEIVPAELLTDKQIIAIIVHYFEESNDELKQLYPLQIPSKIENEISNKMDKKLCFVCDDSQEYNKWNARDCSKLLTLSENALITRHNMGAYAWGCVRAEKPAFHKHLNSCVDRLSCTYYELEMPEYKNDATFSLGFCDSHFPLDTLLGIKENSFGIHSNGRLYVAGVRIDDRKRGLTFDNMPGLHKGCVIGVGFVKFRSTRHLEFFFTINGSLRGRTTVHIENATELYPAISDHCCLFKMEANFGQKPFLFDLNNWPTHSEATKNEGLYY